VCEMRRFWWSLLSGLVGLLVALAGFGVVASVGGRGAHGGLLRARAVAAYGRLPLSFAQNRGQAPRGFDYVADGAGWSLGLGRGGVRLALARGRGLGSVLRVLAPGGRLSSPVAERQLPGRVSSFVGGDRGRWVSGAPTFARVVYRNVWRGVDLAFHGRQGVLEYDLDLAPGADPGRVALRFAGARAVRPDGRGGALISVSGGTMRMPAPRAEQGARGVSSRLVVSGDTIRLALGSYDHARALVVDPALVYLTDLGSGYAQAYGIAVDASGDAYVTGATETKSGNGVAFVTKLNPTGSAVYTTDLGRSGSVGIGGIAVDASGDAYVTGNAGAGFPTTPGAYQTSYSGCCGNYNAFVAKLNPTGSALVYSTYLGGSEEDVAAGIAIDSSGDAYVTGKAGAGFPTTPGAYQTSCSGRSCGFVTKLNPTGSGLIYSTYLGGSAGDSGLPVDSAGNAIALDTSGDAYVTGITDSTHFPTTPSGYQTSYGGGNPYDAFMTKLNPTGSALVYSTYLGGSGDDQAHGLAVDASGDAYITGSTGSTDFPTTPGAYQTRHSIDPGDGFVTKLNPAGSALVYSTYLGGSDFDIATGIAIDSSGDAYITGSTQSTDFPTTPGAYQTSYIGNPSDAFVTKLNPTGSALVSSTYLDSSATPELDDGAHEIAVDASGDAYVTGGMFAAWAAKLALGAEVLWSLQISPRTFALAGRRIDGRCVAASHKNRHHPACTRPIRLRISYQLSAPAKISFTVSQRLPGRLAHGRCVKPTSKNRNHRHCTRLVLIPGTLTVNGQPGSHGFTFNGRIGGHKLTPGHYRLTATPTVNEQTGTPRTVTFTITS
jgi:Beta-propeller repeat